MAWKDLDNSLIEGVTEREVDEVRQQARLKKSRSKFYADESVPKFVVNALRAWGLKVLTAGEAGLTGHADQDHVNYALKNRRVLLTCDTDFLNDRLYPLMKVSGIVVLDLGSGSLGEIDRTLSLIWPVVDFPDFHDRWIKLHLHPNGVYSVKARTCDGGSINDSYRVFRGKTQIWQD